MTASLRLTNAQFAGQPSKSPKIARKSVRINLRKWKIADRVSMLFIFMQQPNVAFDNEDKLNFKLLKPNSRCKSAALLPLLFLQKCIRWDRQFLIVALDEFSFAWACRRPRHAEDLPKPIEPPFLALVGFVIFAVPPCIQSPKKLSWPASWIASTKQFSFLRMVFRSLLIELAEPKIRYPYYNVLCLRKRLISQVASGRAHQCSRVEKCCLGCFAKGDVLDDQVV